MYSNFNNMQKDRYFLYNQDCLDLLPNIAEDSIDLIVIDPPFGVNYKNSFYNDSQDFVQQESKKWLKEMYRILKSNSHCYIFTGTKSLGFWLNNVKEIGFEFNNIINLPSYCNGSYVKNNFAFRSDYILYLSKGKAKDLNKVDFIKTSNSWLSDKRNTKKQEYTYNYPNLWESIFSNTKASTKKLLHPNQKNQKLLEILIKLSSNENDIVLDCFAGSFSTGLASLNTNRKFIGCEKDINYFEQGRARIKKLLDI